MNLRAGRKTYVRWKCRLSDLPDGAIASRIRPGGTLLTLPGHHPDAHDERQQSAGRMLRKMPSGQKVPLLRRELTLPPNRQVYGRGVPTEP